MDSIQIRETVNGFPGWRLLTEVWSERWGHLLVSHLTLQFAPSEPFTLVSFYTNWYLPLLPPTQPQLKHQDTMDVRFFSQVSQIIPVSSLRHTSTYLGWWVPCSPQILNYFTSPELDRASWTAGDITLWTKSLSHGPCGPEFGYPTPTRQPGRCDGPFIIQHSGVRDRRFCGQAG